MRCRYNKIPDFNSTVPSLEPKWHYSARLRFCGLAATAAQRAAFAENQRLCQAQRHRSRKNPPPPPHPRPPGQVHPTARSLGSHRVLPVQLNSGLQLPSTVSGTKMARHSCPFCFGNRVAIVRARLHSLRKNSLPTPMRPGQVHPTARSLSSHRALPVQLNSGLQLHSTVSETKMALLRSPSLRQIGGNAGRIFTVR